MEPIGIPCQARHKPDIPCFPKHVKPARISVNHEQFVDSGWPDVTIRMRMFAERSVLQEVLHPDDGLHVQTKAAIRGVSKVACPWVCAVL